MQLIYEGVDITDRVAISEAFTIDGDGGCADCVELCFSNGEEWVAWRPAMDGQVEIVDGGYRSGRMYVDTLLPEGGNYRLRAYSIPSGARARRWASYERVTLFELVNIIAGELDMDIAFFGVNEGAFLPYLVRRDETPLAFLLRVLRLEGATLKCVNGKLCAIDILWAQGQAPIATLELGADMAGAKHNKTSGRGHGRCAVQSPFGTGSAIDLASECEGILTITDAPVSDAVQAGRWARGCLLNENRGNELLTWAMDFTPSLTGLARANIAAPGGIGGQWIVHQVKHDHINGTSDCTFYRCMEGIS